MNVAHHPLLSLCSVDSGSGRRVKAPQSLSSSSRVQSHRRIARERSAHSQQHNCVIETRSELCLLLWLPDPLISGWNDQIKSNHFYCHITTAQVPWWVKFLWACSRQCRKTTDNLPMDRQCKKTTNNLPMDRQCKKNNKQFTYGQTVQKKQQTIYIWQCKKKKKKKKKKKNDSVNFAQG